MGCRFVIVNKDCEGLRVAFPKIISERISRNEMMVAAAIDGIDALAAAAFHVSEMSPDSGWIDYIISESSEEGEEALSGLINYVLDFFEAAGIKRVGAKCLAFGVPDFRRAYLTLVNSGFYPATVIGKCFSFKLSDAIKEPIFKNNIVMEKLTKNVIRYSEIDDQIREEIYAEKLFQFFDFENEVIDKDNSVVLLRDGHLSGLVFVEKLSNGNFYTSCFFVVMGEDFPMVVSSLAAAAIRNAAFTSPDSTIFIENHTRQGCAGIRKMLGEPSYESRAGEYIAFLEPDKNAAPKTTAELCETAEFYDGEITFPIAVSNILLPLEYISSRQMRNVEAIQNSAMYSTLNYQTGLYGGALRKIDNAVPITNLEKEMLERYFACINEWLNEAELAPVSEIKIANQFGRYRNIKLTSIPDEEVRDLIATKLSLSESNVYLLFTVDDAWACLIAMLKAIGKKKLHKVSSLESEFDQRLILFMRLSDIAEKFNPESADYTYSKFFVEDNQILGFEEVNVLSDDFVFAHYPVISSECTDPLGLVALFFGVIYEVGTRLYGKDYILFDIGSESNASIVFKHMGKNGRRVLLRDDRITID